MGLAPGIRRSQTRVVAAGSLCSKRVGQSWGVAPSPCSVPFKALPTQAGHGREAGGSDSSHPLNTLMHFAHCLHHCVPPPLSLLLTPLSSPSRHPSLPLFTFLLSVQPAHLLAWLSVFFWDPIKEGAAIRMESCHPGPCCLLSAGSALPSLPLGAGQEPRASQTGPPQSSRTLGHFYTAALVSFALLDPSTFP